MGLINKKYKGAIFDLDGTLLDSMQVWVNVDQLFLGRRNIPVPPDYLGEIGKLAYYEAALYTIDRFHLQEKPEELIQEWHQDALIQYRDQVQLKEGSYQFLKFLKMNDIPFSVATASDPELYALTLKRNNVFDMFHSFTDLKETGTSKGEPDIYLKAAEKMDLKPEECVVFEDILPGIRAAKKVNFHTVAVYDLYASGTEKEFIKEADIYIKDFNDPRIKELFV